MQPPAGRPHPNHTPDAVEIERRRLALLLQDEIINQIHVLISQVNLYERVASSPNELTALSVVNTMLRGLLQRALDLEANLHPALLENLGLSAALETLANQQKRSSGVTIILDMPRMRDRLPAALELAIFRTVQDFVMRATKSGTVSRIMIQLAQTDRALICVMEDNGTYSTHTTFDYSQHVQQLGGTLTHQQSKSGGLQLTLTFATQPMPDFTERELEVLVLVAAGLTNKEIALALKVRPRTVKFHLDNVFTKLNITNRTEAATFAVRYGLTK